MKLNKLPLSEFQKISEDQYFAFKYGYPNIRSCLKIDTSPEGSTAMCENLVKEDKLTFARFN